MDLSVIIPCYNEQDNIRKGTLDSVYKYLSDQKLSWEILLVNDGSSDKTSELLQAYKSKDKRIRVLDNPHMGKAATIISGAQSAAGDYILFSDLDQSTPISELIKIQSGFSEGYDIVIGSRTKNSRKGSPFLRLVLAYGNVVMRKLILNLPFKDTQCGFKGLSKKSADNIFSIMQTIHPLKVIKGPAVNAGFDMELLYLARKLGYRVKEVPVVWHHVDTKRVNFLKDALSSVQELLLIRYRAITNAYKISKN